MRSSVRASIFLQRISPFRLNTPKKVVTTQNQLDDYEEKEEHVKFTDTKPRTYAVVSFIVVCLIGPISMTRILLYCGISVSWLPLAPI